MTGGQAIKSSRVRMEEAKERLNILKYTGQIFNRLNK